MLLAGAVLLLSGCSVKDAESKLRFGWPTGVTKQGERMRVLWTWAGVTALILGVIVWGLIFWCIIRYRRRRGDGLPRQTKYNIYVETVCVIFPFIVIVGLFWRTVVVEDYVNKLSKDPDVLIQVNAFKWNWKFDYHSFKAASGQAVETAYPNTVDATDSSGDTPQYVSTVGSSNEIAVLVIPVDRTVQIVEHSEDVVHSFWVPDFLFKRDVIPYGTKQEQDESGLSDNRFEFTATSTGSFVGRCAELCGTYHSQMNFEVRVVSEQVFQNYLSTLEQIGPNDPARQAKALRAAQVPGGAYATTTHPFDTNRSAQSATGS